MDDPIAAITAVHMKSFGYMQAKLHALLRARMVQALEGTGLHGGHVVILATLWVRLEQGPTADNSDPGLTQTQLVQISGVEKSSVVLFLDGLEKDGWIERRRHPADRRAHLVYLTPSGAARFAEVGRRLYEGDQENFATFTPDEKTQLMALSAKLMAHLEALSRKA